MERWSRVRLIVSVGCSLSTRLRYFGVGKKIMYTSYENMFTDLIVLLVVVGPRLVRNQYMSVGELHMIQICP